MKYSIIIVAYKAEGHLRKCIDSINASSIADAEIVVWDNSPTPIFGKEGQEPWSPRIPLRTYYNGINYGFAEGCNRAARQAEGDFFIFLNPDTEVYGDWADAMAKYFTLTTKEGKPIAAVGPISNYVAGLQNAMRYIQRPPEGHAGITTKLLIGFCFIIPATLWRDLGGMDPTLFLGCDDLDLSMRIRESGGELVIASDVFVHHAGHKSMEAAGLGVAQDHIAATEDIFRAKLLKKYGKQEKIPSSDELWGCPIFYTGPLRPMSLSVVMIVRDEEKNLAELLPQLGFADEVIIVDTAPHEFGTLPADMEVDMEHWIVTKAPALMGKVRVTSFPWADDFAAARNHGLAYAMGDWVLWLDADDRVPELSGKLIRAALDRPGQLTAQQKCHFAFILRDIGVGGKVVEFAQQRMFPRIPGLYWERTVHENYGDRANALALPCVTCDTIIIEHHGYSDPEVVKKKQGRNLRLLLAEPESPHKYLHMGNSFAVLGDNASAREAFNALLNLESTWPGGLDAALVHHVRYILASLDYREFMDTLKAWQETDKPSRGPKPAYPQSIHALVIDNPKPDAKFLLAEHYYFTGQHEEAARLFQSYADVSITDAFGTNQDSFYPAALGRLERIKRIAEAVDKARAGTNAQG